MAYRTFEISIASKDGLMFVEVVALDLNDAYAQINEAFFQPEICAARVL